MWFSVVAAGEGHSVGGDYRGVGSSQLLIWFWQHAAAGRNNELPADQ